MTDYMPPAPSGFIYHKPLFSQLNGPRWKLLLWANMIALLPFGVGLLLLWMPYQLYLALGSPLALYPDHQLTRPVSLAVGILIFIASMFLHEWLHGIALHLLGHKPVYYFKFSMFFAGLQKGDHLSRHQYLVMTLTPLVTMSVVGFGILLLLPPAYGRLLLIALLLNTAASLGDLFVAVAVLRAPKTAVFTDDNGIYIFLPIE